MSKSGSERSEEPPRGVTTQRAWPASRPAAAPSGPGTFARKIEWLCLALIVIAALLIRLYGLGSFPDTLLADEADNAQDAVRILNGQEPENGFFGLDWTAQPAFSAYKEAAFISIFGLNIFAIRLSSAVLSTLALFPFYLLLRRQLSMTASLLATLLLATEVWYLNFSRSGWNCIDIGFYMLTAMLLLLRGLDSVTLAGGSPWRGWAWFAGAGSFCALGLYGYPAGRAITLGVAAFLPVVWFFHRTRFKPLLYGCALLFLAEAALFAPQALYIARHWEHFNGRSSVVLLFNDPGYKADPVGTMLHQLGQNLRGPWDGRVNNTAQYSPVGEPQISRITGLLVLLGMALTFLLRTLRGRLETWLWWLMLLAGWALTQLLTAHTPNGARGIGYMPALLYFAAVGLDGILMFLRRASAMIPCFPLARQFAPAALAVLVLCTGYTNVKHYVDWQSAPRTRQDRHLYITAREFPDWADSIVERAQAGLSASNVGQWRDAHPIRDIANPYGVK